MHNSTLNNTTIGIDAGALLLTSRAPGTVKMVREQTQALLDFPVDWNWLVAVPDGYQSIFRCGSNAQIAEFRAKKYSVWATFASGRLWNRHRCPVIFAPAGIVPITNAKIVATYYDTNIFEHGKTWIESKQCKRLILLKLLARHLFYRADVIFMNSHYCRSQLLHYLPQYEDKIFVNYAGLEPLPPPSSTMPSWAKSLPEGKDFILMAGAVSENKNQRRLIEAWGELQHQFPNLPSLVLIGPYNQAYRTAVLDPIVRNLPRPGEIILTGHVSEAALIWAYYHANCYIQPSIAEGCSSFSVYQAMSCGVPVACANTTSHPEGVGNAAYFFDPLMFALSWMRRYGSGETPSCAMI